MKSVTGSRFLLAFYSLIINRRSLRGFFLKMVCRFGGGEYRSLLLREIFRKYYNVDVGLYTHGGCFIVGQFDKYTTVGRYCSIAITATTMNRNHPMEFKSTHAYFFNTALGYSKRDPVQYIPLQIGNDVWIGHNAVIVPNVRVIGDGAVIGTGAVVNKNVPPYAVVVGNPGRVVRYRFPEETIRELLEEKWWEKDIDELKDSIEDFWSCASQSEKECG